MALTAKQQAFIEEYLLDYNATQAAIRAGYSPKTAYNSGWENVRKREIAEAISQRLEEKAMSANEVLVRLTEQARADMGEWLDDDGSMSIAKMRKANATRLLKKVKRIHRSGETQAGGTWEETRIEVELHDAQAALVHIGKHHKLFTESMDVHHSGSVGFTADEAAQAAKELDEWKKTNAGVSSGSNAQTA